MMSMRPTPQPTPRNPCDEPDRLLLQRLIAGPATGEELARAHGLGRAAMWKRIEALRQAGIVIEARPGQGYRLGQPLDLLDAGSILDGVATAARAGIGELAVEWQVDSTNSVLLARKPPSSGARVLLAERQTGGRGRRGRSWQSPLAANLYLSLDRRFAGGLARLPGLSLVAGIAVAESLREATGLDVRLKWPNDLWLDGAKLGGLLVEGGGEHGGPVRAVIGIGLNVRMPPAHGEAIEQAWTDLARHVTPPSRDRLASAILSRLLPALDAFDAAGFGLFRARWEALDALAGHPVRILEARGENEGVALGIAADGGLRIATPAGERILHAGEVSVRTP